MLGRNSAAGMIEWTEPTWRARSTLCTASNSAATSPSLSERTAVLVSASFTRRRALAASSVLAASCASRSLTAGSAAVRLFTSRVNTTAAAGAPPITEENDPSTASTSMFSFSAPEKTTKAPP